MSLRHFRQRARSWFCAGLASLALVSLGYAILVVAPPSGAQSPATSPGDASLRDQGRQVFADKCGKCHDADAAKKLPDGSTLLGRLAARKDPQARLATRLRSMSDQDARAVSCYMEDLIARFRVEHKASAQKY